MRVRQLSPTGDFTFGSGQLNYLINSPEAVAQVVQTSLLLFLGEWYLDLTAGVPYPEDIIGKHSQALADATLIAYISQIQGVTNIEGFQTVLDPDTRAYRSISGTLNTIYGITPFELSNENNF